MPLYSEPWDSRVDHDDPAVCSCLRNLKLSKVETVSSELDQLGFGSRWDRLLERREAWGGLGKCLGFG